MKTKLNREQKDFLRFILICLAAIGAFCVALSCRGSDIAKGYAFTPTDRVTSTKLNGLVDLATINTTFVTDKASAMPAEADSIFFYQTGSGLFRKTTFASGLIGNTNIIMARTEDTSPATNDFILTYDASAGVLKRVALYNAIPLSGFLEMTASPDIGYKLYITSNGVPYWTSMTNLLKNAYRFWQLANPSNAVSDPTNYFLSNHGAPVKTDSLLIWAGNTNKYTTLSNLVTQSTAATTATAGDMAWGYSTNQSQSVAYKMVDLQKFVTNTANSPTLAQTNKLPQTWTTNNVVLGNGILVNAAHGLGGIPQCVRWVLVQTNSSAQVGWGQNREVDVTSFFDSATGKAWFSTEADVATVILTARDSGTMQVNNATTGVPGTVTQVNWVAKAYITWFPTFP